MDALNTVLLRRAGRVALPAGDGWPAADGAEWLLTFETDLVARGWLLEPSLRARFASLAPDVRMRQADWVLAVADEMVGADRPHVPLHRDFPRVRHEAGAYIDRLLVHLFQADSAPCILCGNERTVHPLDPCGHVVCAECFDPARFSACPICGRRPTADNAYLTVVVPDTAPAGPPLRLRRLTLDVDPIASAAELRDDLVERPGALRPSDVEDLRVLVDATAPGRVDWLPEVVPSRATLATVLAWALREGNHDIAGRWGTATDVARTLWVYSGGDATLLLPRRPTAGPRERWRPTAEPAVTVEAPKVAALPRALRRIVLAFLDSLDPATVAEDMRRHPTVWKRLAERLHPFESPSVYPRAVAAFVALRATRVPLHSGVGRALEIVHGGRLRVVGHDDGTVSVRVRTFAAFVEDAVAARDVTVAVELLASRPGELWRRVDHLLRLADAAGRERLLAALAATAARVAPGVLAAAAAETQRRPSTVVAPALVASAVVAGDDFVVGARGAAVPLEKGPGPGTARRVFFPKAETMRTWTAPERRGPLPAAATARVRAIVDGELSTRAGRLDRFDVAVLDAALATVPAPMREAASSAQLAGWPRGSVRRLPDGDVLRLFTHWMDVDTTRVDIDLSCLFLDEDWRPLGHCDYTWLEFGDRAAVHSGDLTSAPAPLGATEYLDLDLVALRARGVHWAVPVVLSYNDVPFEALAEAFAGFSKPTPAGAQFDAARVVQRFDLRGDSRALVPLVVGLTTGSTMWVDAALRGTGYGHDVERYGTQIGRLAADLWEYFTAGTRTTVLDLAAWHAAGRAGRVLVSHVDGTMTEVSTADGAVATVAGIRAAASLESGTETAVEGRVFVAGIDRAVDGAPTEGSVAVLVAGGAGSAYQRLDVADLTSGLVPTA
jgi:hypothetical protein